MLANMLGLLLVAIGGIVIFGFVIALVGAAFGILCVLLKVAIPVALVYLGYRILVRDRGRIAY